jgi:hypothetical protein
MHAFTVFMGSPNGRDVGRGVGFATVDSTLAFANTLATDITFAPACLDADLGAETSYRTGSSVTGSYATNAFASVPGTTGYAGRSY